jgi:hypothetical protein
MREFVGEHYLPAEAAPHAGRCAEAARTAADQLRREGTRVHHVRSILIPEDETCIHLYRAESIEAVRCAAARASLHLDRLTDAVSGTGGGGSASRSGAAHVVNDARARLERSDVRLASGGGACSPLGRSSGREPVG